VREQREANGISWSAPQKSAVSPAQLLGMVTGNSDTLRLKTKERIGKKGKSTEKIMEN
jgi:hypothetical protein